MITEWALDSYLKLKSGQVCEAYVKSSAAVDQRKMARFKTHMNLISQGRYTYRGTL